MPPSLARRRELAELEDRALELMREGCSMVQASRALGRSSDWVNSRRRQNRDFRARMDEIPGWRRRKRTLVDVDDELNEGIAVLMQREEVVVKLVRRHGLHPCDALAWVIAPEVMRANEYERRARAETGV